MFIPIELQQAVDEALQLIREHPEHEYGPRNRKKLLQTLAAIERPFVDRVRGWLALFTARRVLHFYIEPQLLPPEYGSDFERYRASLSLEMQIEFDEWQREYRYVKPVEAIMLAEAVLRGSFPANRAKGITDEVHKYVGNYREHQAEKAFFVELAAHQALIEVSSEHDAFDFLPHFFRAGDDFYYGKPPENGEALNGEQFTDKDWAESKHSDCAAAAAMAWSCSSNSLQLNPQKLLEFWEWWLKEALSLAWEAAEPNT